MNGFEALIAVAVGSVVTNGSNWPAAVAPYLLGRDLAEPIEKITAALVPIFRESQAEAWDKGHEAGDGYGYGTAKQEDRGGSDEVKTPNPHRNNE